MRFITRLVAFSVLLIAGSLLASCSLASPAPVEQPTGQAQALPPVQQTPQPVSLPTRRPSASAGAQLYQDKCVRCHGDTGKGDGAMAAQIQSQFGNPVANLTDDVVARAQTPEQWYTTVTNGRIDKGMPPFAGSLSVDQRWDVIAYAWSLAAPSSQIAQGRQVYTEQCAHCHGDTGKGDGKDATGQLPDLSNFETMAQVEPGRWDQALDSGHVPSFAGTLSADAKRAVVDYIRTFAYDSTSGSVVSPGATPSSSISQLPSSPEGPSAPFTIQGTILNGTAGASVSDNLSMTLYILPHQGNDQNMITHTFQSGVGGRYSITTTEVTSSSLVAVGIDYKDLSFFSDVGAYQPPAVTLPITIYESTPDAGKVNVDTLHIIVTPGADGLDVSEIYVLSNTGDRFVAGFGTPVMHFALPADATNLQIAPEMQSVLKRTGDGLDYFAGIPVGPQAEQIVFQYTLPTGATAIGRPIYHPVNSVNLLVQGDPNKTTVSSDQLVAQGAQVIQGTSYQQFTATDLKAGQTLTAAINPAAPPLDWRILLGIALVIVGVVGIVIWQRSQRKQVAVATVDQRLEIQKEALIDQIAALDDDFTAGQIDEVSYKAQRAKLKEKLMKVMSEE